MPFDFGKVKVEDGILFLTCLRQSGVAVQIYSDGSSRITLDQPASELDEVQKLQRLGDIVLAAAFFAYDGDPFKRHGGAREGAGRPRNDRMESKADDAV